MNQTEPIKVSEAVRQRLIVALDVPTGEEALEIVSTLSGVAGMFKVGFQLFCGAGPDIIRHLIKQGERVFLDLKFHDIPNTVAAAGVAAARLGVSIFNVHAAGGREMMLRTAEAVAEVSERERLVKPNVIAVTVLTSSNQAVLTETGITIELQDQVKQLALLAEKAQMDGVVTSAREIRWIRAAVKKEDFLLVTPGMRPVGSKDHDQKRVMSPRDAISAGSDYLVVGRPITAADDPVAAAHAILQEMQLGLKSRAFD